MAVYPPQTFGKYPDSYLISPAHLKKKNGEITHTEGQLANSPHFVL